MDLAADVCMKEPTEPVTTYSKACTLTGSPSIDGGQHELRFAPSA
ncbi:MAG: hypothetical protein R3F60_14585 [bacterium]